MKRLRGIFAAVVFALGCLAPAMAYTQDEQIEMQIGQQEYQQLSQKGEILSSSPYYSILNPIADRIKRIADPQYFVPFHFILVNESQPNAFAVPGGNVYVTTAMMKFVKNKEELAGVLCHETSHDIHHDVLSLYKKDQQLSMYGTLAEILLGRGASGLANSLINLAANLEALHFSRNVEENADQKGAITCAQAGLDPYGLIWLMQAFQSSKMSSPPEILSDHPTDSHRIGALQNEFASDPALFARYNPNVACGTPVMYTNGFYNQYKGVCGAPRRETGSAVARTHSSSGIRHITPVKATSKKTCPAGWKYC
ncbi:MAG TPA: M48 family metallopeptidase [Candidatus Rubrimentiphilum sp.]|nr:M48 family metallopeptidase [Candidatus Rubrimentiphilum sp.]